MIKLEDVTVFNDIRERLAAITPAQVEAAERRLKNDKTKKKDEKPIGIVTSEATRALYVLYQLLAKEHQLEHAKGACSDDENVSTDHEQRAALLDMLSDVARELFWAQAKIDLGFHEEASVGLRQGWQLVKTPDLPSGPEMIMHRMMGGTDPD